MVLAFGDVTMSDLAVQDINRQVIGERIRRSRKEAGVSLTELARRVGVSERAVTRWQTGHLTPSLARLYAVAQVVDKPIGYFLDEETVP